MKTPTHLQAYIIAARRTALGRIGGLHRRRRVEDLAAPVILAALADSGLDCDQVDEVVVGNATAGNNPARLIALATGIPEAATATTVDQQDASGLVAILQAVRLVVSGEADVVIAGGAESLSTAPWRIARPRNVHQIPHFIPPQPIADGTGEPSIAVEGSERLARSFNVTRARQDAYAHASLARAIQARRSASFAEEIVALRSRPEEARDQTTTLRQPGEFADELPFLESGGTLTPANTSHWHDGAAFVVVVSADQWQALGCPPALELIANASQGVGPDKEANAPIAAVEKLYQRLNGFDRSQIAIVETSENSAAQAIALADALGIDEKTINPGGGAIARGHPFGAAGAVQVVRLFTQMIRAASSDAPSYGIATQGANGGLGVAALLHAVSKN